MAGTFKFELVSPERILLSVDADDVVVPGIEGDFTVYAGHAPVISTLKPGFLEVTTGGSKRRIFLKSGFAEVNAESVTVLAETAYDQSEMDAKRIADELATAESELAAAKDDEGRMMAEAAVSKLRAMSSKGA